MKKNYYLLYAEVAPNVYLHYNAFSNQFLLLNKDKHDAFSEHDCAEIERKSTILYQQLINAHFIIPDGFDEKEVTKNMKKRMRYSSSMYQVMINTTLDCNLNCWYCYENRVLNSKLQKEVLEAIKRNFEIEYNSARFNTLKISFFGGEPFIDFNGIKVLLDYAKSFCENRDIELIADFTTNATLITNEHIQYLKKFKCHFQITLDGNRNIHNTVKKDKLNPLTDTYQQTINALHLINSEIPNRWIAVRVNFDNRTLGKIDEIISDIDFLDRTKSYVILKKVWQVLTEKVDKASLFEAIQKFFDKKFLLDYYIMPKGCICFAERNRYTLFNYDGKIFKCSTISSFDDNEALGKLDLETGYIQWDLTKTAFLLKDMEQEACLECKWFPVCLGPCNRQLMANKQNFICTFDAMNMNAEEYLMYSFKYHLLQQELFGSI